MSHAGTEQESYYHQLLTAVLVHPEKKTVLPLAAEATHKQDGASKTTMSYLPSSGYSEG
jgi:hypothetical protein